MDIQGDKMFCSREQEFKHPKWTEWCKKSEEEQLKIAEENGWMWYTDWYDLGDILRSAYEQADTSNNVTKKYDGYDRWDEEHQIETSAFTGSQWTVYNPCTNQKCPYNQREYANTNECGYFGCNERQYDCFNDLFASIQAVIDICGRDKLDSLQKDFNIHKDIIGWFKQGNKYFKNKQGSDKMSKPFFQALSELKFEDEISIYWIDGMMYVNDENDGQASTNTSLYQAYRFAVLIQATIFDYTATDEEVKELSEQLLDLIDEDWYKINVWEYFDDIADDFKHLTDISLDIDDKRAIVCHMTEMDDGYDLLCSYGSATYIAKKIWDYIKGNEYIHFKDKNGNFQTLQGCDNKIINQLADKYLQSDKYDLKKFAEELHKAIKNNEEIVIINGALWVNSAKYEYVDKIIINSEEVDIYNNGKIIGSILRENIQTIYEDPYEKNYGSPNNLEDVLSFDIKKVGDF